MDCRETKRQARPGNGKNADHIPVAKTVGAAIIYFLPGSVVDGLAAGFPCAQQAPEVFALGHSFALAQSALDLVVCSVFVTSSFLTGF